jgi:hypothetical protein
MAQLVVAKKMRPVSAENVLIGREAPVHLRHPRRPSLLHFGAAFFSLAHRALTAATSRARPSGLIFRFDLGLATGTAVAFGRPGFLLPVAGADAIRARAALRLAISASINSIISVVLMPKSVSQNTSRLFDSFSQR